MIVANLATYPLRMDQLIKVVSAISPQVDYLNIVFNQYKSIPPWLEKYKNIVPIVPEGDHKDTGKFLPSVQDDDYVFLIDDDILYPADYVTNSIKSYEKIELPRYVGGYHGSIYRRPTIRQLIRSPGLIFEYKKRVADFREVYDLMSGLGDATIVDQIGTGTAILRGKDMPAFDYVRGAQKFVDVRFARWCSERELVQVCFSRQEGWLQKQEIFDSIYENFTVTNPPHVSEEIMRFAFKNPSRGLKESKVR